MESHKSQSLTTLSLPLPSKKLSAALADQSEGVYGGPGGYESRPTRWKPPALIGPEMREEARQLLSRAVALAETPAEVQTVSKWLSMLGILSAGNMTAADAQAKLSVMSPILATRYPAAAFTPTTLEAFARSHKWFPTYAELAEYLEAETAKLRGRAERLSALAVLPQRIEAANVVTASIKRMPAA